MVASAFAVGLVRFQSRRFWSGINDRYEVRLSLPAKGGQEYHANIADSDTVMTDATGTKIPFRIRRSAALDIIYQAITDDERRNQVIPREVILDDAEWREIIAEYMAEEAAKPR